MFYGLSEIDAFVAETIIGLEIRILFEKTFARTSSQLPAPALRPGRHSHFLHGRTPNSRPAAFFIRRTRLSPFTAVKTNTQ